MESDGRNLSGMSDPVSGVGLDSSVQAQGAGTLSPDAGMPPMAEVNLVPQKSVFAKNKKVWLIAGGTFVVLMLVIVGVMIGMNREDGMNDENRIVLNHKPEGYGDDPASSTVVAVFDDEIGNRLREDENYTFEDAMTDYERAYIESEGELKFDIALSYAYFVFLETDNPDEAVEILNREEKTLDSKFNTMRYYTEIIDIYDRADMSDQVDYYRNILDEISQSWDE